MKKSSIVWLVIIIIILIAGIWYFSTGSSSNTTNVSANISSSTASTSAGADIAHIIVLETASTTKLGTVLVAMNGMTLYQYTKDTPGVSNCTGQCAAIWPPYTISADEASSSLVGDMGANGTVSTILRADGSYQVTYNGKPLYFYSKDVDVGDTNGQNIGGIWFVVNP